MKVELLPTAVSGRALPRGQLLTSYIIDGTVAIDAGALGLLPDIDRQERVRDVFLTHSHMDHVASLPIFLDNVFKLGEPAVKLHGSRRTLEALARHMFNDLLWPDFFKLEAEGQPFVRLVELEPGISVEAGGLRITPIEVDHVVPTYGYLIEGREVAIGISSDTGPTERLWRHLSACESLAAVFLEASYPDELEPLARLSGHLTPALFEAETRKLGRDARFIAVHMKPRFYERTAEQLARIRPRGRPIEIGEPGQEHEF